MRVTFIYPDLVGGPDYKGYFYSGLASLSAVLKKEGHDVSLIHVTKSIKQAELINICSGNQPGLIAFSSTTNMFPYVQEWSGWIKCELNVPIICGGVHPTLCPDETIASESIDMICIGEGEGALTDLCQAMEEGRDISGINNLWIKTKDGVERNPLRPLIEDLDSLPFPDRTIYDFESLYYEDATAFMASRGCPYNCTYCCNHALRKNYQGLGKYVRFRSVDNVIEEIRQTVKAYPFIKKINFADDILPLKKGWFSEFAEKYSKEIAIPFTCNIYPSLVSDETISLLKKAGCEEVQIGVESGNEEVRKSLLKRRVSDEQLIKALRLCREAGFRVYSYNMLGLPSEDFAGMLDTVKVNAKHSDISQVTIFYPYKGTMLYDLCKENGLLTDRKVDDYSEASVLNFPKEKLNQIVFAKNFFWLLAKFYSRPINNKSLNLIERFLESGIAARTLFPASEKTINAFYKHKHLHKGARFLKRKILD